MSGPTYLRMKPAELAAELAKLDLSPKSFCRTWGVNERTMSNWLRGHDKHGQPVLIPPWVYVAFAMMNMHGGLVVAKRAARQMIEQEDSSDDNDSE